MQAIRFGVAVESSGVEKQQTLQKHKKGSQCWGKTFHFHNRYHVTVITFPKKCCYGGAKNLGIHFFLFFLHVLWLTLC